MAESTFKTRMLAEHGELMEKLTKLQAFLWGETFNDLANEDKTLLIDQLVHMQCYANTLAKRISRK